jgi:hypothetical protein
MDLLIALLRAAACLRCLHARAGFSAGVLLLVALVPAGVRAESVEYAVKAAYLYKFGIYVEWPADAFASPTAPLNLCVAGSDPFGGALDNAVSGQHIDKHPIAVRRMKTVDRNAGCHILYLGFDDEQRTEQALAALRGQPVLTVGDRQDGGIISFVISDNRVRFNIDEEAAAQSGLVISSKLLSLALHVTPKTQKETR